MKLQQLLQLLAAELGLPALRDHIHPQRKIWERSAPHTSHNQLYLGIWSLSFVYSQPLQRRLLQLKQGMRL
jgi:hypothetical protein